MNNVIILTVIVMLALLFLKAPVYAAVLGGSIVYFIFTPGTNPILFAQRVIVGTQNISLLAIPFFVGAGVLMNYTGVTSRIMNFCETVTGRMNGGLAQVNVLLSTLMGGLSGSSLADAAMEAKLLVPAMEKQGYSKAFSTVLTAASAMITPIIPPGIAMILYGCLTDVSIGKLFVSGVGMGIIMCVSMMLLVSYLSKKRGYTRIREEKLTSKQFVTALKPAALPLCMPILIIGGIRIGVFTATEAGAGAIVFALCLGLMYRELKFKDFCIAVKETVVTTSSIMLIIGAASVFSWILTKEQLPQRLTVWMLSTIHNKYVFLMAVNVFLIIVGMFIEGNASMIILVPLLAPVAVAYDINPVHFAMMYIFNGAIGSLTPPMGTLMFVTCGVTKCKTKDFIKEAVPFYLLLFVLLMLFSYVPILTTGLVDLVY